MCTSQCCLVCIIKFGKVIGQQTMREQLDYDPSEGEDWNWEDYE